ncbi:MAG: UDP-N-acetylmuramoyl-L-alanine--D-glutamate ligase [Bdellovibrionales bacterium]|nr:UDP-N-acetylmuramoyl-L-alanine--D-glutamate ligase [Bdellovibrionales bacterium]
MAAGLVLKGRKVVVVGANASGVALSKYLIKKGATVVLADAQPLEKLQAELQEKIDLTRLTLEAGELQPKTFEGAALVVVAPGTALDHKALEAARTGGVQVVSELEFASLVIEEPILAVAGTKGKSTTATMLAQMLEAQGAKVFSAVRHPLSEYMNLSKAADYVVAPTNSFQLEGNINFKPKLTILLNLHEDHADRYPNFESYLAANREILKNVDDESITVINADDPYLAGLVPQLRGKILMFGAREVPEGSVGAWCTKTHLNIRTEKELHQVNITNLRVRGGHNRDNLMAASLAALALGCKIDAVIKVVDTFSTLSGRVEFTKRINAVAFYNDSCATTVPAVIRTLQAFSEPVILIMGGRDKNTDYSALVPHVRHRVKNLILVGEAKEKINRALGDFTETFLVGTLEEAVLMAYQKSRSGDVVLLSPACDSRDVYKDHEDRGEHFKKLIVEISQPRKVTYI